MILGTDIQCTFPRVLSKTDAMTFYFLTLAQVLEYIRNQLHLN